MNRRLLIDSHAFVWLAQDDERLSTAARDALTSRGTPLYLSVVTIWELAIKHAKGGLTIEGPFQRFIEDGVIEFGFQYLPIRAAHAHFIEHLPPIHGDPFDRMLVAQAHVEGLHLVSKDRVLERYEIPIIW